MDAQGTLEVIAEISIAFTGFAGIVGALAGARLRPAQLQVWLSFWLMIESGLGTLFAALFPMLPYHLELPDRYVWSASSGLIVILIVCHVAFMSPRFIRALRDPSYVRLPVLQNAVRAAIAVALVSQLLNALGVGLPQSAGGFLIGLYFLLLVSGLNFVQLVAVLLRSED
ncbi:MAG: hypothetical protein GY937_25215 [bacterium]|nr:hypothetical protein [bacterium]